MLERRNLGVWAAAALALAAGAFLAWWARGLAGEEEAVHYLLARYAPGQPTLFLSLAGRPLVTAFLALPAQGGLLATRLAAALCTAAAAFALARLARSTGWIGPIWMAALFLVQPFLMAHAATAMTEPVAAALVAWGILAVVERRWLLLVVVAALLPTARLETLVFWPAVAWLLWRGAALRYVPLLPVPLLLWNLAGGIPGRDPLWLLHQSVWKAYPERDYFHYVMSYVWIVGLGLFVPILASVPRPRLPRVWGKKGAVQESRSPRDTARRRALTTSWVVVGVFFVVYTALAVWHPITFGNLRYFAYAAPAFALLAAAGLHAIAARRSWWTVALLVAAGVGAGLLWNHPLMRDFGILTRLDLLPLEVALVWLLVYALPTPLRKAAPALVVVLGVAGLARNHRGTLHLEPRPEHEVMAAMASALVEPLPEGVKLYAAHPMLAFYRDENPYDRSSYLPVNDRMVSQAEPGSVFLWDSHYAWRQGPALEIRKLLETGGWRYLHGHTAADSSFSAAFFVREGPDSTRPGMKWELVNAPAGNPEAWARAAFGIEAGIQPALEMIREDPQSARAWHHLAGVLSQVGRKQEAWRALAEAERLAPENPYNKGFEAELHRIEGNPEGAIRAAREALALDPGNGDFQYLLGMNLLLAKRRDEAEPFLREAAWSLPKRAEVQYRYADFLLREERWQEAEPYLSATLALQPQNAEAAVWRAEVAFRTGRPQVAVDRLKAFVRDDPTAVLPYVALSDFFLRLDRREEARAILRDGMQKTGGDPKIASRLESLGP